MSATLPNNPTPYQRWQHFSTLTVRAFHVYAGWLVSISWKRFTLLAVALIIGANVLQHLPPFNFKFRTGEEELPIEVPKTPKLSKKRSTDKPAIATDKPIHYEITIDDDGLRIEPRRPAFGASAPASSTLSEEELQDLPSIAIGLPKGVDRNELRRSVEETRKAIEETVREAREKAREQALDELREQLEDARAAMIESNRGPRTRVTYARLGDLLDSLAWLIVLSSTLIKAMYKSRIQAEVKAAQATETAEAESLRRQVVEARMAAMQAQVEPHFLFNTLASIDHLIETDPARASQMQKNLIALLRASMPTMREANATGGVRELGREIAVIRPYLEILKVRMEERLMTEIDVPEGLLSAEFPPMMIQSLVENSIKHGLEPKAEGGSLKVKAEIVHGKLQITVADTGLGFGRAATSGTGVGLANIRERLSLLYGTKGTVTVTENQPSGTVVTICVPYRSRNEEGATA